MLLSASTDTSATSAMMLPNDSCIAAPRARPSGGFEPQPAFSAASCSAPRWRGDFSSSAARYSTGSFSAAQASSSIMLSIANAVCVFPTERHQSTGTWFLGQVEGDRPRANGGKMGRIFPALHGGAIPPAPHHELLERRVGEEGLPHDRVQPGHGLAVPPEARLDAVQEHGPVVPAAD